MGAIVGQARAGPAATVSSGLATRIAAQPARKTRRSRHPYCLVGPAFDRFLKVSSEPAAFGISGRERNDLCCSKLGPHIHIGLGDVFGPGTVKPPASPHDRGHGLLKVRAIEWLAFGKILRIVRSELTSHLKLDRDCKEGKLAAWLLEVRGLRGQEPEKPGMPIASPCQAARSTQLLLAKRSRPISCNPRKRKGSRVLGSVTYFGAESDSPGPFQALPKRPPNKGARPCQ